VDAYQRVLANPGSIAARKALAAAWHAAGDARADLIDKQLAVRDLDLAKDYSSPLAKRLADEVKQLVAQHGRQWAGRVADLVEGYRFHRGLVAQVTVSGQRFPDVASELFTLAPIQHLDLVAPLGDLNRVFATPELKKLVSLECARHEDAFGDAGANILARSRNVASLRWIDLMRDAITEAGAGALAASPYLEHAVYISLKKNPADATPYAQDYDGAWTTGRPPLAQQLERTYGKRPWLAVPAGEWPPTRDDVAVTP
jgi:hypothetical protein